MSEPVAILNGAEVAASAASISVADMGFVHGAAVAEMIRTFGRRPFGHRPFRLEDHLDRLRTGIDALGIHASPTAAQFRDAVEQVVDANARLIPAHHDLGVIVFVTAGGNPTYLGAAAGERASDGTWGVHSFPLPFELWAEKMHTGQHLIVPAQDAVPASSLNPRIKWRSRVHWYLADRSVRKTDPLAAAMLVDADGFLTETSTASLLVVKDDRIRTPRSEITLDGVSRRVALELADELGIDWEWADLTTDDLADADEAFVASTPYCLMPVGRFNGQPVGNAEARPIFRQIVAAWNDLVGIDIIGQIQTVADERR